MIPGPLFGPCTRVASVTLGPPPLPLPKLGRLMVFPPTTEIPGAGDGPAGFFPAPPAPGKGEVPALAITSDPRPVPVLLAPDPSPSSPLPGPLPRPMPSPPPDPPRPALAPPAGDIAIDPLPPLPGTPNLEPGWLEITTPALLL